MTLKQNLEKIPSIKGLFLKRRKSQIHDISFHIKVLDKDNPRYQKKIISIKAEINKIEGPNKENAMK